MKRIDKSSPLFSFPLPPYDRKGKNKKKEKEAKRKKEIKKKRQFSPSHTFLFSPRKGKRAIICARTLFLPVFSERTRKGERKPGENNGTTRREMCPSLTLRQLIGGTSPRGSPLSYYY